MKKEVTLDEAIGEVLAAVIRRLNYLYDIEKDPRIKHEILREKALWMIRLLMYEGVE